MQVGEIQDDVPGRVPTQARFEGRHPARGIGAPETLDSRTIALKANEAFELYQRNPGDVDPTFVQVLCLQQMCNYGKAIEGLTGELATLRREIQAVRAAAPDLAADASPRDRRLQRRAARRERPSPTGARPRVVTGPRRVG